MATVPTRVLSASLVGFRGDFPRGRGNYIIVGDNSAYYAVINVSYEDLKDAIQMNLIGGEMEGDVYDLPNGGKAVYVTDSRLPERARSAFHWYNGAHHVAPAVIRKKYSIPDGTCICCAPDPEAADVAISWTSYQYDMNTKIGKCRECGHEYVEPMRAVGSVPSVTAEQSRVIADK